MASMAEDLFSLRNPKPSWQIGQTVSYGVIRGGERIDLKVKLISLPFSTILSKTWGAILFALLSQVVAGFVLFHRPNEPAARALFFWAMSGSHTIAWTLFLQINDFRTVYGFWMFHLPTSGLWLLYWAAGLHLALTFPKPMEFIRRFPRLIPAIYISPFVINFAYLGLTWRNSTNTLEWLGQWASAGDLVAVLFVTFTLIFLFLQYRSSKSGAEKAKMRWVVYGATIAGLTGIFTWLLMPWLIGRTIISTNLFGVLLLPFPISLAIAIWRHKLFDIDLIIRRTIVYTVLTSTLALVYFGSVLVLQGIFTSITGQRSTVVVVFSTLVVAALFNPLRNRIQVVIDRRFYRRRYDAEQTLANFSAAARDEVEIESLAQVLLASVKEALQPDHYSLWIQSAHPSKQHSKNIMDAQSDFPAAQ